VVQGSEQIIEDKVKQLVKGKSELKILNIGLQQAELPKFFPDMAKLLPLNTIRLL